MKKKLFLLTKRLCLVISSISITSVYPRKYEPVVRECLESSYFHKKHMDLLSLNPETYSIPFVKKAYKAFLSYLTQDLTTTYECIDYLAKTNSIKQLDRPFNIERQKLTLLMVATIKGDLNLARYLIEQGVSIDATNNTKETALFFAVLYLQPEIVNLLILHKADKTFKNKEKKTVLNIAQEKKNALVFANFKATSAKEKKKTEQALRKIDSIISLLEQDKN